MSQRNRLLWHKPQDSKLQNRQPVHKNGCKQVNADRFIIEVEEL
jgi:hypothetical protein